jgi:hypothetical protein
MVNQQWPWNPALRGGALGLSQRLTACRPNLTVKAGVLRRPRHRLAADPERATKSRSATGSRWATRTLLSEPDDP